MGPRMGPARSCAGVQQRGAAQSSCVGRRSGGGGYVGVQWHGRALGRSVWLYRGAVRGCEGAQQRGAAQGRSAEQPRGAVSGRGGA